MLDKNDLMAIAELLHPMSERLESMGERLDTMSERLDTMSERLDTMSERQDTMSERQDTMSERLETISRRQDKMEIDLRQTRILVEQQDHNISLIAEQYGEISRKLERVYEIDELKDRIRTLERIASTHTVQIKELKNA